MWVCCIHPLRFLTYAFGFVSVLRRHSHTSQETLWNDENFASQFSFQCISRAHNFFPWVHSLIKFAFVFFLPIIIPFGWCLTPVPSFFMKVLPQLRAFLFVLLSVLIVNIRTISISEFAKCADLETYPSSRAIPFSCLWFICLIEPPWPPAGLQIWFLLTKGQSLRRFL